MSATPSPHFDKLVAKLREVFQIDQPDLDFGIYRIINARAAEISDYLENQLRAKVDAALTSGQQAGVEDLKRELAAAEQQARELGADPATLPKVKDLRARVAALSGGATEHRDAVFSHLLTFFSRYYDRGDFISQRRYKGDTYAIPYSGEEVVLHWANKDQYYTKSGENFSNYTFSLADGRRVHFRLASADTAKDDRKDTDLERRFRLIAPRIITRTGDDGEEVQEQQVPIVEVAAVPAAVGRPATPAELILWFEYVPLPKKGDSQDTLNTRARDTILADAAVKARWLDLAQRKPTEKNSQRTLLDKQLEDYTQKNKADYFIHKDLGIFLRRELDFYIKNEVMHLDDVQNAASFADIEKSLRMIQCLRAIALDLVAFLAQLEDFQKKLWLKKKFVVESHYCLTLDRIYKLGEDLDAKDTTRPGVLAEREWLLAQIAANPKQIAAWIDLGLVKNAACEPVVASTDPLFAQASTVAERLRTNPFLMVDTQWFSTEFKYRLCAQLHDLDAQCDGLLVHSENFQALRFIENREMQRLDIVLTDPPYNTKSGDFIYKDTLKHSSWLAMMSERLQAAHNLLKEDGAAFFHIDENEHSHASLAADFVFGPENRVGDVVWVNSSKNDQDYISMQHEYIVGAVKNVKQNKGEWKERKEGLEEIYKAFDGFRRKRGTDWKAIHVDALEWYNTYPESSPIHTSKHYSWMDETGVYFPSDISGPNFGQYRYDVPHPLTGLICKEPASGWRYPEATMKERIKANLVHFGDDHTTVPNNKTYLKDTEFQSLTSIKYRDGRVASKMLDGMFGEKKTFPNPKDVDITTRVLRAVGQKESTVLDFFSGSGTIGHAVINLNREDNGRRRYILIEMGDHFDSVLTKRLQKVVYSQDWKKGKPQTAVKGLSHGFQYLRLESYEDTLNNLALKRPDGLTDLFDPAGKEDYLLHYMLNVESQASLLSVEDFKKPFDYKLRIAANSAGACQARAVDLVETFNYLLGLRVAHLDAKLDLGYVFVSGKLPDGQSCLIVWRDCDKLDYEATSKFLDRHKITPNDSEYDVVYINGDHNIPTVAQATEAEGGTTRQLTLRQIEPEFIARMFAGEEA